MTKFYIDGSAKGLTMGYGIVEVDEIGFMKLHEGYSIHPNSTSNMAELYALEETLKLISDMGKNNYTIILDQYRILRFFDYTLNQNKVTFKTGVPTEDFAYISRIRALFTKVVERLAPEGSLNLMKIVSDATPSEIIYENTAHKLSRNYFNCVESIFLQDDTPLKESSTVSKLKINHLTKTKEIGFTPSSNGRINLDVRFDGENWHCKYADSDVMKSRSFANVVLFTLDLINNEIKDTTPVQVGFFSDVNMYRSLQNSLNHDGCPADLRDKGNKVLELISEKKIRLVTKRD